MTTPSGPAVLARNSRSNARHTFTPRTSGDKVDEQHDLAMLIRRCALRDQKAFLALYDATSAKLYGVILRILKREYWAEEVLQNAYLKVWQSADGYNSTRGKPMTWLISIARNRAIDFLRGAEYAAAERQDELDEELLSVLDPLRSTETGAAMTKIAEFLKEFHVGQRKCILMVYHQGYTPTEVSRQTGYPLGTVKTWIRRGLEKLRTCMCPRDATILR